jgi:methylated-DNA-[protein]-cysteine S-methyltransferase
MKHMLIAQCRIASPLGPLTLATTEQGLALAWFDAQAHRSETLAAPEQPDHPVLQQAARELAAYWGDAQTLFAVPLDPQGTPFQQAVWQVLRGIVPGTLLSYGEVARRIHKPAAVRAVGAAIGRNPLGIIVPCHRVVGSTGSLTGYAGGLPRKQALLQHEGAQTAIVGTTGAWPASAAPHLAAAAAAAPSA